MRAIEVSSFGGAEVLEPVERERPEPDPEEVLLAVEAAGVNFADIHQRLGLYRGGPSPPFVPGFEVAGRIHSTGEDVDLDPGERVAAMPSGGGYAEYVTVDARSVFPVPDELSFEEAAGVQVHFLTAHGCLFDRGRLSADERVLIHAAAGGVGSAGVQLAKAEGAEVFGTASSPRKLEHAAELGCDHPINYEETDFSEVILEKTDGDGVDLVVDGVGGEAFEGGLDALAPYGRLIAMGVASGQVPSVAVTDLLYDNLEVIGYHLGNTVRLDPGRALAPLSEILEGVAAGDLTVHIGAEFPLEEATDAHRHIESRESLGKVILIP